MPTYHPVIKTTSIITKLRVVFNGSKPTANGVAVNDIQMKGPTVQDDLFSILVRISFYKFTIGNDIEKMYRQVKVRRSDQDLQ